MTWLAWVALAGPAIAFGFGWAVGWGSAKASMAKREGELEEWVRRDQATIDDLRNKLAAAIAAAPDDDEFDRMLDEAGVARTDIH